MGLAPMDDVEDKEDRSPEELPPEEPLQDERNFGRESRGSFDLRSPTFSLGVIFRGSEKDLKDIMLMMEKQGMKFAYTTGLRAHKLRIVNYNPEYRSRQYERYQRRGEQRGAKRGSRQEYADQQQQQSERSY